MQTSRPRRHHRQTWLPQSIRCDNGPELTSRHFLSWNMGRKEGNPQCRGVAC